MDLTVERPPCLFSTAVMTSTSVLPKASREIGRASPRSMAITPLGKHMLTGVHYLLAWHVLLITLNSALGDFKHQPFDLLRDCTKDPSNLILDSTSQPSLAPEVYVLSSRNVLPTLPCTRQVVTGSSKTRKDVRKPVTTTTNHGASSLLPKVVPKEEAPIDPPVSDHKRRFRSSPIDIPSRELGAKRLKANEPLKFSEDDPEIVTDLDVTRNNGIRSQQRLATTEWFLTPGSPSWPELRAIPNSIMFNPELHQTRPLPAGDADSRISRFISHAYKDEGQPASFKVSEFSKLEFNEEIFRDANLLYDRGHFIKLARMDRCLREFPGKILSMHPDKEKEYESSMNTYVKKRLFFEGGTGPWTTTKNVARRKFLVGSSHELFKLGDLWIDFWKRRAKMDLHIDFQQAIVNVDAFTDTSKLYVLYLFFVDMINTTAGRKNHDPRDDEDLFKFAKEKFEEYRGILVHQQTIRITIHDRENQYKQKNKMIPKPQLRESLWGPLDYWMEKSGRFSTRFQKINSLKPFYNDVFTYSIRNFNKKMLESQKLEENT
ncbi:hypothetical protein PSTT_08586 [Puccinia striiformis]|uniref:Uncharacterized protein n=2 Tax=Puccinia striiformis TaxID=27350 RepID=A0A2S4VBX4_9BASI|nr:hypothetical protein PSTT_08586 [Puccinia striiformis]